MPARIRANPDPLQRRMQITTEPAGGADQRREEPGSPGPLERSARHGASSTVDPWLGLLIVVSSAVVFYGAIAAFIWHFL